MRRMFLGLLVISVVGLGLIVNGCGTLFDPTGTTATTVPTTTSTSTTTTTTTTTITINGPLTKDYYPNTDGNAWIYKELNFFGGTTTESTAEASFNGTQTVEGLTTQIQRLYEILPDGTFSTLEAFLIVATNTDVKEYGPPDKPTTEATQVDLLFPSVAGDRWTYGWATEVHPNVLITTEALAVESVSTPAGTFNCFKVKIVAPPESPQAHVENTYWYAKNVGLVKRYGGYFDNYSGAPIGTQTFELKSKNF